MFEFVVLGFLIGIILNEVIYWCLPIRRDKIIAAVHKSGDVTYIDVSELNMREAEYILRKHNEYFE
jgi:hypothetical protein